jgi:hypothetical protein
MFNLKTNSSKIHAKSVQSEIVEATKQTFENSTFHAIPNLIRNKFKLIKSVWLLFFLASSTVCGLFILDILAKYNLKEVVSKFEYKKEATLPFPIVFICNGFDPSYDLKLNDLILKAEFNLKKIDNLEKEFYKIDIGVSACFQFNSRSNLKYVEDRPVLPYLDLDLFVGSASQNENHMNNGFTISIIDQKQSNFERFENIYLAPGTFTKIYVHKTVIKKQPFPFSGCTDGLDSKVKA